MAPRKRSWWIRFVEIFLLWIGGRAIFFSVLTVIDPNFRRALGFDYWQVLLAVDVLFGILALGAGVAIYLRYRHALMMATAALAIYTGSTIFEVVRTSSNLPAAREAYRASREARGLPIRERQLDQLFSPEAMPMLWVTAAVLCIPPYVILLWRKHELEPTDKEDVEDD